MIKNVQKKKLLIIKRFSIAFEYISITFENISQFCKYIFLNDRYFILLTIKIRVVLY